MRVDKQWCLKAGGHMMREVVCLEKHICSDDDDVGAEAAASERDGRCRAASWLPYERVGWSTGRRARWRRYGRATAAADGQRTTTTPATDRPLLRYCRVATPPG